MKKVKSIFFTSHDGEVWVNKNHIKNFIEDILDDQFPSRCKRPVMMFAKQITEYLDTLYYKEEPGEIGTNSFYCGNCRRGFLVRKEFGKIDHIPCPRCGAQSYKSKEEKHEKKNHIQSS